MGIARFRLAAASLDQLIEMAQASIADDSLAMGAIIMRFERLSKKIARSLTPSADLGPDLENAARVGLVQAVRHHHVGQPGFPNYAKRYMRGEARRERDKWLKAPAAPLPDDMLDLPDGAVDRTLVAEAEIVSGIWGEGVVAQLVAALPARQQRLLQQRHVADLALADIARIDGTSESAVSQRLRTAHRAVARQLVA